MVPLLFFFFQLANHIDCKQDMQESYYHAYDDRPAILEEKS